MNGRNIPFVSRAKYLGVNFDESITWSLHIEIIETKAFRAFTIINFLLKSECLSASFT
jgi:hypothetical protein